MRDRKGERPDLPCVWRDVYGMVEKGDRKHFRAGSWFVCVKCGRQVPVSETLVRTEERLSCADALLSDLARDVMES